jgi:hypothetical protein
MTTEMHGGHDGSPVPENFDPDFKAPTTPKSIKHFHEVPVELEEGLFAIMERASVRTITATEPTPRQS